MKRIQKSGDVYIDGPRIRSANLSLEYGKDYMPNFDEVIGEGEFKLSPKDLFKFHNHVIDVIGKPVTDYSYQTTNSYHWFMWLGKRGRIIIK